jgi:beta-galactosidase
VDIVSPAADLSGYRLVVAPALHVLPVDVAENLKGYVESGGVLAVTPRSGVKDEANAVVNQRLPGLLSTLCGVEVEEYDSLAPGMGNEIEFLLPELAAYSPVPVGIWCDLLQPRGATVVATYRQQYYAGRAAITMHRQGEGLAVYVGTLGDATLCEVLAGWLCDLAGIEPLLDAPAGVEVTERWQGDRRLLFLLNHTDRKQEVCLDRRYTSLLGSDGELEGPISLAPRDVLVLAGVAEG